MKSNTSKKFIAIMGLFASLCVSKQSTASEGIAYGHCTDLKLDDIPYGDLGQFSWPQQKPDGTPIFRITQEYNTSYAEGWCDAAGYPGPDSEACNGKHIFYGHDGIDVHESPDLKTPGVNSNIAIQGGKVIIAKAGLLESGWGYRMAIATRIPYSHQILVANYAHMDVSSLKYSVCDEVLQGTTIGMEGNTGWGTGPHVHVTFRIFDSIEELNAVLDGSGTFEVGYSSDTWEDTPTYLANYLSPYHLITDKFLEFECNDANCPTWAKPHALAARRAGIDFGRYDGYFAVNPSPEAGEDPIDLLRKGESTRWFKVARKLPTTNNLEIHYTDVGEDSIHFPYVATLLENKVLSKTADCDINTPGPQFCEDQIRTRAEFIKMVIMTFLKDEFNLWMLKANAGKYSDLFDGVTAHQYFTDLNTGVGLSGCHWATPYILFAAFNGYYQLVDIAVNFRPNDSINKLEAIKVLMLAREWFFKDKFGGTSQYTLCDNHYCPIDQTCIITSSNGTYEAECIPMPACVPDEGESIDCYYGGGYNPCDDSPECTPGETKTQSCGNGGTQTATCDDACAWGNFGDCEGSGSCTPGQTASCGNCGTMTCEANYSFGDCSNEGVCTPGQTQVQTCNGSGYQTRTCESTCTWGQYDQCSIQQVCTPGETQTQSCTTSQGQSGTQTRTCDSYGQWPATWSTCTSSCVCSSGVCCDGCNYRSSSYPCDNWTEYRCAGSSPGDDGQYTNVSQYCSATSTTCSGMTQQSSWMTYANCSSTQTCTISGGLPVCEDQGCTETYIRYGGSTSCFDGNLNDVEICLHVQQVSGSVFRYWLCKTGSSFQNNISFVLKDLLHPNENPLHSGTAGSGTTCTDAAQVDFSYLTGTGLSNGATLRGDIQSPANTGDYYRSAATIRIYKECQ